MRLICPSCGAQYEVDDSVIPDGGRDVQCSNCGHAWFQRSAKQLEADSEAERLRSEDAERAAETEAAAAAESALIDETGAATETEAEADPAAYETVAEDGDDENGEAAPAMAGEAAVDDASKPAERPRKTLDDAVRNVLREEAERESRARQEEGSSLESQPDLGLAAGAPMAAAESAHDAARHARSQDDLSDFDDDALVSRASRRELLPDIEEINSTLRPTSEREGEAAAIDAPETVARRRSGFRMGFSIAILIAVLLLGVYVLAPLIASAVPGLDPVLTGYVAAVDNLRNWLDGKMLAMTETLQNTGQQGN